MVKGSMERFINLEPIHQQYGADTAGELLTCLLAGWAGDGSFAGLALAGLGRLPVSFEPSCFLKSATS